VIPVTREPNGALRLGGHGDVVEWVVEMRRFDETRTLDRLADDNAIDLALADKLARAVAATHNRIPVLEGAPWIAALSSYIAENDAAFRANPDLFDPAQTGSLDRDSRLALHRLRPLLAARGADGMVRRGHGDLHLGNVALLDGNPVLFDAVEFSPLIAAGDVIYDLAFLLMDLADRGLSAAANVVLNRYLAETRRMSDLDAVAALPFFMSLRAAIRANVTASRAAIASKPDRAEARSSAKKYFALACRLIRPAPPVLVGIGGLSGTGKSQLAATLAPELAPAPGAIVLRSDVERKAMQGRREDERLPPHAYAPESTARVYAMLVEKAGRVNRRGSLGHRRRRIRSATGARRVAKRGASPRRHVSRAVSHGRYGDPRGAGRVASGRCLGCRRSRRAGPGALCARAQRLAVDRCLRRSRMHLGARPRTPGVTPELRFLHTSTS